MRARVMAEAPIVFITLLSVLVGLVLTDLVTEARGRMRLWPLDLDAIRTWGQLFGTATAALSVWMVVANLGISRRRPPQLSEASASLGPPLLLLCATSFVGRDEVWPWFYGAGVYLVTCSTAFVVLVRQAMDQPGGAGFVRLLRMSGVLSILVPGAPLYIGAAYLDQHGWLPRPLELALIFGSIPASIVVDWMFFRDLRHALDNPEVSTGRGAAGANRTARQAAGL